MEGADRSVAALQQDGGGDHLGAPGAQEVGALTLLPGAVWRASWCCLEVLRTG